MSNYLRLRPVTDTEEALIRHLAASRTKPARLVQRAKVIEALLDGFGVLERALSSVSLEEGAAEAAGNRRALGSSSVAGRVRLVASSKNHPHLAKGPVQNSWIKKGSEVVHTEEPSGARVDLRWTDSAFQPDSSSYYYVCVVQKNDEEAISSPVWVN